MSAISCLEEYEWMPASAPTMLATKVHRRESLSFIDEPKACLNNSYSLGLLSASFCICRMAACSSGVHVLLDIQYWCILGSAWLLQNGPASGTKKSAS